MTKRTFKKSVSATIATVMLLMVAGCGNSQQPTNTQQSTTEAVAANKTQSVTTAPETTKAPETTTKAEEKTTVSSTESASQVTAIQTTEAAASANNSIDYMGFLDAGTKEINSSDIDNVNKFVEEFGVKNFEVGERIDLNTINSFNLLSEDLKDFIMIAIADQVADFTSDTLQYKIVNYDRTIQMGFVFNYQKSELTYMVKG